MPAERDDKQDASHARHYVKEAILAIISCGATLALLNSVGWLFSPHVSDVIGGFLLGACIVLYWQAVKRS